MTYWKALNVPEGWKVDSGWRDENAARASATQVRQTVRVEYLETDERDGETGPFTRAGRWCVLVETAFVSSGPL